MIDPLFFLALLAVFFFNSFYLAAAAWMFLLLIACVAIVPLFAFEGAAQFLAPRLQRAVIDFRFKPARGLPKLITHLSLDRPLSPEQLLEGARQLASAAHAVTMRHPNPLYGPVRLNRLETALEGSINPANRGFLKDLRKAWITPQPGLSPGGLILFLRATIGRLLFGRWLAVATAKARLGLTTAMLGNPTNTTEPWKTPNFPELATFLSWKSFADAYGFDTFQPRPSLLPLADQRKLAAITAQLHGTKSQALLARLLNPSFFGKLQKLAEYRRKWEPWHAARQAESVRMAAEQAERTSYRAKGTLTGEEVTALVAAQAQNSILLNRVWPPGAPARGNSWLGGLPCLPPDMAWPRNQQTGLPMHFLAQVDCADLPTLNGTSPLPRDGLLLFFSDLDEERLQEDGYAVVHVPKTRQSVPPRALPDDLPEINHSDGQPSIYADEPGRRHYPKWPVVPIAVKIWAGEQDDQPKTFNHDYLEQARAAHNASLAAVMPPTARDKYLADLFPYRQRKDADGNPLLTPEGKGVLYTVYDPTALPEGFPFFGAGIDAFVTRLQQQATKAARQAANDRSYIDAKWNDTEEKRARKRAEVDQADTDARAAANLATQARDLLGTLPALSPVPPDRIAQLHRWLAGLADTSRMLTQGIQSAASGSLLDLARTSVTDPALAASLPASVYAAHATSLLPSPRHSQHLMLGPAQTKTNSTAGNGVRLLCLDSDYGPGMMFCDCGVIEYWIAPEDLAALRFDRAWAETAGG